MRLIINNKKTTMNKQGTNDYGEMRRTGKNINRTLTKLIDWDHMKIKPRW